MCTEAAEGRAGGTDPGGELRNTGRHLNKQRSLDRAVGLAQGGLGLLPCGLMVPTPRCLAWRRASESAGLIGSLLPGVVDGTQPFQLARSETLWSVSEAQPEPSGGEAGEGRKRRCLLVSSCAPQLKRYPLKQKFSF